MNRLVIPLYGLASFGAGLVIGNLSDDHPAPPAKPNISCAEVSYDAIMATPGTDPLLYIDYLAMDGGYGQWTLMAPDSATPLGFATQEDSIIYPNLECIHSMPEYPSNPAS